MSAKSSTAAAFLALILAIGVVGYAAWATWMLELALARMERTQERSLKEMMISIAHTEGQLGRVKEAMKAFDLQQWLATVEGPLVDRLEERLVAAQRQAVREAVEKWAGQIESGQTERLQSVTSSMKQARAKIDELEQMVAAIGASVNRMQQNNEKLLGQYEEGMRAEFVALQKRSEEMQQQLDKSAQPVGELRAALESLEEESRELKRWLEERTVAAEEFRTRIEERLAAAAEAAQRQTASVEEQIAASEKRWQGLFLTLRENHEAELQSVRDAMARLEEERALALERLQNEETQRKRQQQSREQKTAEPGGGRLSALMEFCSRHPESVLCRDLR